MVFLPVGARWPLNRVLRRRPPPLAARASTADHRGFRRGCRSQGTGDPQCGQRPGGRNPRLIVAGAGRSLPRRQRAWLMCLLMLHLHVLRFESPEFEGVNPGPQFADRAAFRPRRSQPAAAGRCAASPRSSSSRRRLLRYSSRRRLPAGRRWLGVECHDRRQRTARSSLRSRRLPGSMCMISSRDRMAVSNDAASLDNSPICRPMSRSAVSRSNISRRLSHGRRLRWRLETPPISAERRRRRCVAGHSKIALRAGPGCSYALTGVWPIAGGFCQLPRQPGDVGLSFNAGTRCSRSCGRHSSRSR